MSSSDALASVTATLMALLTPVIEDQEEPGVTAKSPSIARKDRSDKQINIFLYGVQRNAALSNAPMPREARSGESAFPPLALVLKYLVTAYGQGDADISGQKIMGHAMSILHDNPILNKTDILNGEGFVDDVESNLHQQIESIKITADVLTLDDMSKLWTSFQSAEYRLSTGYEVSVVLIDSSQNAKTPLPVLKRGEEDQGVSAQANLIPPFPELVEIIYANQQVSTLLGDVITLNGHHLDGDTVIVHFSSPHLSTAIEVPVLAEGTTEQISVQIPNDPVNWVAGFYTISVVISKAGEQERTTNVLPLFLAPQMQGINPPNPIVRAGSGSAILTISCSPEIRPEQRVSLLLGDREIILQAHLEQTDTLEFSIENAPVGSRFIRLRIDGVDSQLVDRSVAPPEFKAAMEVTFT